MSIKRIPVCPFCGHEMKEYVNFEKVRAALEGDLPSDTSPEDWRYWISEECGFVALWRKGEPK